MARIDVVIHAVLGAVAGASYYVKAGLRWQNGMQRQVFPKFWKPLPIPKKTENGAIA